VPLLVIGPVLVLGLTCASVVWSVWQLRRSLPAYQMVIDAVTEDERVKEVLGEPLTFDDMIKGRVQITNDHGESHLEFAVAGPKGQGLIISDAAMADEQWLLGQVTVTVYEERVAIEKIEVVP
jgi:hypothetical protein